MQVVQRENAVGGVCQELSLARSHVLPSYSYSKVLYLSMVATHRKTDPKFYSSSSQCITPPPRATGVAAAVHPCIIKVSDPVSLPLTSYLNLFEHDQAMNNCLHNSQEYYQVTEDFAETIHKLIRSTEFFYSLSFPSFPYTIQLDKRQLGYVHIEVKMVSGCMLLVSAPNPHRQSYSSSKRSKEVV